MRSAVESASFLALLILKIVIYSVTVSVITLSKTLRKRGTPNPNTKKHSRNTRVLTKQCLTHEAPQKLGLTLSINNYATAHDLQISQQILNTPV